MVVDPLVCFGHPVVENVWVPTRKLYDAYLVEGGIEEAAQEFDVDPEAVIQA